MLHELHILATDQVDACLLWVRENYAVFEILLDVNVNLVFNESVLLFHVSGVIEDILFKPEFTTRKRVQRINYQYV